MHRVIDVTDPIWADPPPIPPRHAELADQLRHEPGRWALLGEQMARSTGHHVTSGRYAAFRPAGSFEAKVCNTRGNRGDVYVRFRGKRARS